MKLAAFAIVTLPDPKLADVFAAHGKVLYEAAMAEFQRMHRGQW